MEDESQCSKKASQIATQTRAQCKSSTKQRQDGEEQRNEIEYPCESREIIVVMGIEKCGRHSSLSAKILRWVEWKGCLGPATTVGLLAPTQARDCTQREEGPCGETRRAWDGACVGREEPEVGFGIAANAAGEDDEELEENTSGEQDPRGESNDGTYGDSNQQLVALIVSVVIMIGREEEEARLVSGQKGAKRVTYVRPLRLKLVSTGQTRWILVCGQCQAMQSRRQGREEEEEEE